MSLIFFPPEKWIYKIAGLQTQNIYPETFAEWEKHKKDMYGFYTIQVGSFDDMPITIRGHFELLDVDNRKLGIIKDGFIPFPEGNPAPLLMDDERKREELWDKYEDVCNRAIEDIKAQFKDNNQIKFEIIKQIGSDEPDNYKYLEKIRLNNLLGEG